ncbi:hypothetical protein HR060_16670 [Catenovulum sp. SM1970]|uniref:hypothetical protein n=1 Tax=Marinifaba aquimaris TaxID=2741323 RepID=UPI0015729EDC|nr:hypothetical protein [Marinifaba aquimaris]NTS78479.1 hypothetical protein [Marinifaba aquimaris]
MRYLIKITLILGALVTLIYQVCFYLMPSITVVNLSGSVIKSAKVILPSNQLDFGQLADKETNTLYYSLEQADGVYQYRFSLASQVVLEGRCGYVTQSEYNKRVVMTVSDHKVRCE